MMARRATFSSREASAISSPSAPSLREARISMTWTSSVRMIVSFRASTRLSTSLDDAGRGPGTDLGPSHPKFHKSSGGAGRRCGRFERVRAVAISWSALTLATGLLAAAAQSPPARKPVDVSKLGPQVGERVPDFNLKDQNGKSWTLQSVMGSKGAMLVFFRSADW